MARWEEDCTGWEPGFAWLPTPLIGGGIAFLEPIEGRRHSIPFFGVPLPFFEYRLAQSPT